MSKVSANLPAASAAAGGQPPSRHPMATGAAPQQPMPGMLPPQSPSAGTTATGGTIQLGMTAEGAGSAAQVRLSSMKCRPVYNVYTNWYSLGFHIFPTSDDYCRDRENAQLCYFVFFAINCIFLNFPKSCRLAVRTIAMPTEIFSEKPGENNKAGNFWMCYCKMC